MAGNIVFPGFFDNIDYYLYLIKISWPAVIGLFIVFVYLGLRLYLTYAERSYKRSGLLVIRFIIIIAVLGIYQDMFNRTYGDWFNSPETARGIVCYLDIGTKHSESNYPDYIVTIISGEEKFSYKIDYGTYSQLQINDLVELEYLPQKKDVFRCTILTRQAQNYI